MHLTIRVTKAIAALTVSLPSIQGRAADQQVLDLTKQSVAEIRSMGVPGQSAGGRAGEPAKAGYELPLLVQVKRLRFQGESVNLELRLTNTGRSPLGIPSCLDGLKAFKPGSVNHRSLEFGLEIDSPSGVISEPIEVTFGSSAPECSAVLEPNRSLRVVMGARLPPRMLETSKRARAFVAETRFEDDRYWVKERSQKVESRTAEVLH